MGWLEEQDYKKLSIYNPMCSSVSIDYSNLTKLVHDMTNLVPDTIGRLFTNPADYLASLMYLPFSVPIGAEGTLNIGLYNPIDVKVNQLNVSESLYDLGEYFIPKHFNNFADFNGYTKILIYLPYYGFAEINPNDVLDKWVQFRLSVDFQTGMGTYYIGVSDTSIVNNIRPKSIPTLDINTRIIGTYLVQIGHPIPIGQSNASDIFRSVVMGAVKTAGTLAAVAVGDYTGAFITSTAKTGTVKTVKTIKRKNASTGNRMLLRGRDTTVKTTDINTTTDKTAYQYNMAVNEAFNNSTSSLNSAFVTASMDKPNSPLGLIDASQNIYIVFYRPKILPTTSEYGRLYGKPLGEIGRVGDYKGYTEISSIHIEGYGFNEITEEERGMLNEVIGTGILLPDKTKSEFSINGIVFQYYENETWSSWVSKSQPQFSIIGSRVFYNNLPINNVKPSDYINPIGYFTLREISFYLYDLSSEQLSVFRTFETSTWAELAVNNIYNNNQLIKVQGESVIFNGYVIENVSPADIIAEGSTYNYNAPNTITFTVNDSRFTTSIDALWIDFIIENQELFSAEEDRVLYKGFAVYKGSTLCTPSDKIEPTDYKTREISFTVTDIRTQEVNTYICLNGEMWGTFVAEGTPFSINEDGYVTYNGNILTNYSGNNVTENDIIESVNYNFTSPEDITFTVNGTSYICSANTFWYDYIYRVQEGTRFALVDSRVFYDNLPIASVNAEDIINPTSYTTQPQIWFRLNNVRAGTTLLLYGYEGITWERFVQIPFYNTDNRVSISSNNVVCDGYVVNSATPSGVIVSGKTYTYNPIVYKTFTIDGTSYDFVDGESWQDLYSNYSIFKEIALGTSFGVEYNGTKIVTNQYGQPALTGDELQETTYYVSNKKYISAGKYLFDRIIYPPANNVIIGVRFTNRDITYDSLKQYANNLAFYIGANSTVMTSSGTWNSILNRLVTVTNQVIVSETQYSWWSSNTNEPGIRVGIYDWNNTINFSSVISNYDSVGAILYCDYTADGYTKFDEFRVSPKIEEIQYFGHNDEGELPYTLRYAYNNGWNDGERFKSIICSGFEIPTTDSTVDSSGIYNRIATWDFINENASYRTT